MKLLDLISFDREHYFQGAVQADWFYQEDKCDAVASSYVFHGKRYYGVSDKDVVSKGHRLLDTASFAENLADKLYSSEESQSLLMTIAGYGTGKSHLAVSLASLFSGDSDTQRKVVSNLSQADQEVASKVEGLCRKKNFVLVLNGMQNFNLDAQILKQTKEVLQKSGIDPQILRPLTKSYEIARHFVERNFSSDTFNSIAVEYGFTQQDDALKTRLLTDLESNGKVMELINAVYEERNGDSIQWERGLCGADILQFIQKELCGEGKNFHKILILFDEFGRYIEYVASQPAIAGDASLQQIFEAVQEGDGGILFVAFIQSELSAYLSRIDKTSNIMRYVGRYESSENLYLSTNFETILASRIMKSEQNTFETYLDGKLQRYQNSIQKLQTDLRRWTSNSLTKTVWEEYALFESAILRGCFPLHPITVWILSNLHQWLQQRSALSFVAEMIEKVQNNQVKEEYFPFVYPIEIVDSGIYHELLNAEEKGFIPSQFCMLYRDILVKVGNKLNESEEKVLKGILLLNICRFSFREKEDAISALRHCVNLSIEEITQTLKFLEHSYGVIAYDDSSNTFDFLAEASGFNEFKRLVARYYSGVEAHIGDCDESLLKDLMLLDNIETSFAQEHQVSSVEWVFAQKLLDCSQITESYLQTVLRQLRTATNGDTPRGLLIFAYCHQDSSTHQERLSHLYNTFHLESQPIQIIFLDDSQGEILLAMKYKLAMEKFSSSEKQTFQSHLHLQTQKQNKDIVKRFRALSLQRLYVGEQGLVTQDMRLTALCLVTFKKSYPELPPFSFDGFEKKNVAQARKYHTTICTKLLDRSLSNVQSYQSLSLEEKNRVKATLSTEVNTSWKVFDQSCRLNPPGNPILAKLYELLCDNLSLEREKSLGELFSPFLEMPYGMNETALALFISYFISIQGNEVLLSHQGNTIASGHVSNIMFKQGKWNRLDLFKVSVLKNPFAKVDLLAKKCQEVLANTQVEKCSTLQSQLSELVTQTGTTTENQLIHAEAKGYLDEGLRLFREIYKNLDKAQQVLDATKEQFQALKFVAVFPLLQEKSGEIQPHSHYEYADDYNRRRKALLSQGEQLLGQKYTPYIAKLQCDITQLSQLNSTYQKAAKQLKQAGYIEESQQTLDRIQKVEEEIHTKQKYETVISDFEHDISFYKGVKKLTFPQCQEALDKFSEWQAYVELEEGLSSTLKETMKNKMTSLLTNINLHQADLETECTAMLTKIQNVTSPSELKKTQQSLHKLSVNTAHPILEGLLGEVEKVMVVLEELPNRLNDFSNFVVPHLSRLNLTLENIVNEEKRVLLKKEEQWIASACLVDESIVTQMDPKACTKWLTTEENFPNYLSEKALLLWKQQKVLVEKRLHESRVEGVIALFHHLSDEEQKVCLAKLLAESALE